MSRINKQLFIKPIRGVQNRTKTLVVDNTGSRFFRVFNFLNTRGVYRRYPRGGIGSLAQGVITKGKNKGQVMNAIIVKQRAPFRIRGRWAQGNENEVVLMNKDLKPIGTKVSCPVLTEIKFFNMNIGQILRRLY